MSNKKRKANLIVGLIILFVINIPCFIHLGQGSPENTNLYFVCAHVWCLNILLGIIIFIYIMRKLHEFLMK